MFRFGDTERLDRTALQCALAGAVCVSIGFFLPWESTNLLRWAGPAVMIALTAPTMKERLRGFLIGSTAVLGYATFAAYGLFADVLAGSIAGFGLARETHLDPAADGKTSGTVLQKGITVALGALAWPLALHALSSVELFSQTQTAVPPMVVQAAAGGIAGLLMGLTTAPLYAASLGDPIADALKHMQPTLDGELRGLILRIVEVRTRALKLLHQSRAGANAKSETWRGLNAVALTAIELTNRFASVDRVLSRLPAPEIEVRITAARAQLQETTDPGVRRDVERMLTTLEEQRQQVERLVQGRARLVARLQSELASMEKTEMAFALLASGDAALAGLQLEAIGTDLGRQAHEFEAEGSALQEMLTVSPRQALQKIAN